MADARRRRLVAAALASTAAWQLPVRAQPARVVRVGALHLGIADGDMFQRELRDAMREQGYVEGRNVVYEFRAADGKPERLSPLAAELVRLKVDVIVALYVPCALAAKEATRDIPIVILAGDPVETGIVPSLGRPGGNVTGVSLMAARSNGKSVELFRDMLPSVRRIAVLGHATNPVYAKAMLDEVQLAGGQSRTEIHPIAMVRGTEELESAFATFARERADALVVQGSLAIRPVTELALRYRLPSASTPRAYAEIGGLMAFGADGPSSVRQGAKFVHRVLQGTAPKDLPIEQPIKYELAINVGTAKAMGIRMTDAFLARTDLLI